MNHNGKTQLEGALNLKNRATYSSSIDKVDEKWGEIDELLFPVVAVLEEKFPGLTKLVQKSDVPEKMVVPMSEVLWLAARYNITAIVERVIMYLVVQMGKDRLARTKLEDIISGLRSDEMAAERAELIAEARESVRESGR